MTTPKRTSQGTVVKEGDSRGPGGIPMMPGTRPSDLLPDRSVPEPETPDISLAFQDTDEEVERLEACPDGEHSWWRAGRRDWMAAREPRSSTAGRLRLEPGQRVIVMRVDTQATSREYLYVATVADREAHLAAVARQQHLAAHPDEGDYTFLADVTPGFPVDVREVIASWRERTIRAVVLGGHVSLQVSGGSWTAQVDDRDEDLVHRYEPLLVAELEGRTLPCSVPGCAAPARAMARVSVPICLEHLALPVGTDPARPGRFRSAVGSVASAIGA